MTINDGMDKQIFQIALATLGVPACGIAKQLKIDRATFSRICNGWIDPSPKLKKRIAVSLNVAAEDLFPKKGGGRKWKK